MNINSMRQVKVRHFVTLLIIAPARPQEKSVEVNE